MLVAAKKEAGPDRILLSEGNSEPFLGHFDLFLTLNAFEGFIFVDKQILSLQEDCAGIFCNFERTGSFAGPRQIAPVFLAVYGGYFVPFGTIFYYTDLSGGFCCCYFVVFFFKSEKMGRFEKCICCKSGSTISLGGTGCYFTLFHLLSFLFQLSS